MSIVKRVVNLLWMLLVVLLAGLTLTDTAQAAEVNDVTVRQTLQALEIIDVGTANTTVDRATLARMLVQSSAARNTVAATGSISPFADVSFRHAAAGYIRAASQAGYMTAYADGKFHPEEAVNGGTAVRAVLALLGYSRDQYGVDYWQFASSLGLLDNLNISDKQNINQQQANRLFYNTLKAVNASGKTQLETLGFSISGGVIDLQSIISATASGPLTIRNANWYAGSGLKTDTLIVYRNDNLSTLAALQTWDVVYYNTAMNTAWAYSDKASGVFKAASPSRLSPVSVNISGLDYSLSETAATKLAASTIEYGETLILLLGSDGSVADILRQSEIAFDLTGFATAADKFVGTDVDGSEYNGYTLTLITADGSVLTYEVRRNYSNLVGRMVKFSYSNGEIGVLPRSATTLSGTFDTANLRLGDMKLADDVTILEVYSNGAYDTVYPQRLDGIRFSQGQVLHYTKNADGAISRMFISGVTGDSLQYGIITEVSETKPNNNEDSAEETGGQSGGQLSGAYSYVLSGKNASFNASGFVLNAQKGPATLTFKSGQLHSVRALEELRNVKLGEGAYVLDNNNNRYLLGSTAQVYQYINGEYKLLSLKQARELDATLTAYYDKAEEDGGRIRILIVNQQ